MIRIILALILAHMNYPESCCHGNDCHPVACEELQEGPLGTIMWRGMHFTQPMVKISADERCHVCHQSFPICVFLVPTA